MIKIRLTKVGRKNKPFFRLIVSDNKKDPWGDFLEILGNYDPHTKEINLKTDRIKYWLEKGAQTSDTVHNLLVSEKVLEGKKVTSSRISKKRKEKLAEKEKEAKAKKEEAKPEEKKVEDSAPTKPEETPKKEDPKPEKTKEEKPSSAEATEDKEETK